MGKGSGDLGMARFTHDDHTVALRRELLGCTVHLLNKGTGCIDHRRAEFPCLGLLGRCHAMCAKDERGARSVTRILDNGGTTLGQTRDNPRVMNQGPQRTNAKRTILEGILGHLERTLDAIAGACLAGHLH